MHLPSVYALISVTWPAAVSAITSVLKLPAKASKTKPPVWWSVIAPQAHSIHHKFVSGAFA